MPCDVCKMSDLAPSNDPIARTMRHEGRDHAIVISGVEHLRCSQCGAVWLATNVNFALREELNRKLSLMTPTEIFERREAAGLTQAELASQIGSTPESICRWERGSQSPTQGFNKAMRDTFHRMVLVNSLLTVASLNTLENLISPSMGENSGDWSEPIECLANSNYARAA